jgi:hypothetical protein
MQALHRDLDLMGQVWLSELYAEGRLPAAVLCKARKLFAWFKTYDPPVADSPLDMWQRISAALLQGAQKGAAHACRCLICLVLRGACMLPGLLRQGMGSNLNFP